jgi:hypothetical protein
MATTTTTSVWELPESYPIESEFFRPHEKKQLQTAFKNFLINTKPRLFNNDNNSNDEENVRMVLQSKIQLFQLFIRSQPVNIRSFR